VLVKNAVAFGTRYLTNGLTLVEWDNGNLSRRGESLSIIAPAETNLLTFSYSNGWHPETFNTGHSLVAVNLAAPEPAWSTPSNWRPSRIFSGTPGSAEPPTLASPRLEQGMLLVDLLENGPGELWASNDLQTWTRCEPDAWFRTETGLSINLRAPSLAGRQCTFFQFRANVW
jgi:hypothetical protein